MNHPFLKRLFAHCLSFIAACIGAQISFLPFIFFAGSSIANNLTKSFMLIILILFVCFSLTIAIMIYAKILKSLGDK